MERKMSGECEKRGCRNLEWRCKDCGRLVNTAEFPKSEWISVKDRLPEDDKQVIGWMPDQYKFMTYEDDTGVWYDEEYINWEVTHWMPLPELPK